MLDQTQLVSHIKLPSNSVTFNKCRTRTKTLEMLCSFAKDPRVSEALVEDLNKLTLAKVTCGIQIRNCHDLSRCCFIMTCFDTTCI